MIDLSKLGITPGPWQENKTYSGEFYYKACIFSGDVNIASMREVISSNPKHSHVEPQLSNDRRLMSMAPEMLEALIRITINLEENADSLPGLFRRLWPEYAIPIIEKATGHTYEEIRRMME